jgi:hypothetical protein
VVSGGQRYLDMRRRLVRYFERKRCLNPDDLAHETLNRVARRLEEAGQIVDAAPARYLAFPALGVTAAGRGVIAFSMMGRDDYPSAGYAMVDAVNGAGAIHVIVKGLGPEDGYSAYKATSGDPDPVARWGDYSAAAVDGSSIWIGSEYVGQTCTFAEFVATGFACGGTRVGGAN